MLAEIFLLALSIFIAIKYSKFCWFNIIQYRIRYLPQIINSKWTEDYGGIERGIYLPRSYLLHPRSSTLCLFSMLLLSSFV